MDAQTIIDAMKVLPEIDPEFEIQRRIAFIQAHLKQSGLKTLVLGISGGIDSTTCGRLAQLAIEQLNAQISDSQDSGSQSSGSQDSCSQEQDDSYQFVAVRLPFDVQTDEEDAQTALAFIKPSQSLSVNVKPGTDGLHQETLEALEEQNLLTQSHFAIDFAKGNVKARVRMTIQFEIAGILGGLVLGTDHSAENVTGFYTKYGDGACDLAPLFGLNKRQVRQVAQTLGVPQILIDKTPTADLECHFPSKADELALGLKYDEIDDFLEGKEVDEQVKEKIIRIYLRTEHKRQPIPTVYD